MKVVKELKVMKKSNQTFFFMSFIRFMPLMKHEVLIQASHSSA